MSHYAILIITFLTMVFSCGFSPKVPKVAVTADFVINKDDCVILGNTSTSLNSDNIKDLQVGGDKLLIATWGGGISIMSKDGSIATVKSTTFSDYFFTITSDFCNKVAGSKTATETSIISSCVNASGNHKLDWHNGSGWLNLNGTYAPVDGKKIVTLAYSPSNFLVIEDSRTDNYLISSGGFQSVLKLINTTTVAKTDQAFSFTDTTESITIDALALVAGVADKENDWFTIAQYADADVSHGHGNQAYKHLALVRIESGIDGSKNPGTPIKPIPFGANWEAPLTMAYKDATVSAIPFEVIYVSTSDAFYVVEINSWSNANVQRFTTADGILSTKVNQIAIHNDQVWLATDAGLNVFNGNFAGLTKSNSNLPSNNVQAVTSFNNSVWVGTDNGLCKVTEIE